MQRYQPEAHARGYVSSRHGRHPMGLRMLFSDLTVIGSSAGLGWTFLGDHISAAGASGEARRSCSESCNGDTNRFAQILKTTLSHLGDHCSSEAGH